MTALAQISSRLDTRTLVRGVAAGLAWGVTVATALLAFTLYQCGTICLGQIVETTALSVAAGIITIGPLALLHRGEAATIAQ